MYEEIILKPIIFGMPAIAVGGIITFLSFICAATIAILTRRGITKIPFKWHPRIAILSLILAFIHGIAGILLFLKG